MSDNTEALRLAEQLEAIGREGYVIHLHQIAGLLRRLAAQQAATPALAIDYDAAIAYCYKTLGHAQGTKGCVAFAKGAEWYRDMLAATPPAQSKGWTGNPPGMLQDDSRELSRALASKPDAMRCAREAAEAIAAPPSQAEPPLLGRWHHGEGHLCSGTLRIARADFDTNPTAEFRDTVFDWVVETLNAELRRAAASPTPAAQAGDALSRKLEDDRDAIQSAERAIRENPSCTLVIIRRLQNQRDEARAALAARVQAERPDGTGRTPTDYALEHAEYLAAGAERLLAAINEEDATRNELGDCPATDTDTDIRCEIAQSLKDRIYEFRKRRDRAAAPPAPTEGSQG